SDLLAAVALALLEDLGRPTSRLGVVPLATFARITLDLTQWEMPTPPPAPAPCRAAPRARASRPIRFRPSTAPSSIWSAGTIQAISNSSPSGSCPYKLFVVPWSLDPTSPPASES